MFIVMYGMLLKEIVMPKGESNLHDRFAVAVVQNRIIVGHIPQNISTIMTFSTTWWVYTL